MKPLYLIIFAILIVGVLLTLSFKKMSSAHAKIKQKEEQLRNLYRRQAVYLCGAGENWEGNLVHLYGETLETSVRPGMKIVGPNGAEYTVKEVYVKTVFFPNEETPNKPDLEIPSGMAGTTIVIETDNWDWKSFRENIKREGVLALKIR